MLMCHVYCNRLFMLGIWPNAKVHIDRCIQRQTVASGDYPSKRINNNLTLNTMWKAFHKFLPLYLSFKITPPHRVNGLPSADTGTTFTKNGNSSGLLRKPSIILGWTAKPWQALKCKAIAMRKRLLDMAGTCRGFGSTRIRELIASYTSELPFYMIYLQHIDDLHFEKLIMTQIYSLNKTVLKIRLAILGLAKL